MSLGNKVMPTMMMLMITIGCLTSRSLLCWAIADLEQLHLFAVAKAETNTGNTGINSFDIFYKSG